MTFEHIQDLMESAINDGVFPGAVLRVSVEGRCVIERSYGVTDLSTGERVTNSTVFDLASLTKPLATAPAFMLLVQKGLLSLETPIGTLLEPFERNEKSKVTVAHLLTHTSGLTDYKPYYKELAEIPPDKRKSELKRMLVEEPLVNPIGSKVVYSDIGYMILAWICEELTGMTLSVFVQNEIYQPLGVNDLYYIRNDASIIKGIIASTENCPWRGKVLKGEVHDDNAWVMGGDCGHAGLFGTAQGVDELLDSFSRIYHGRQTDRIIGKDVMTVFLSEWNDTRRTPGFDMPSPEGSSSGRFFTGSSIGHLGYTGTSFWMDIEKDVNVILLSNRVHPSRDNIKIRDFRPHIHDAVMSELTDILYI